MPQLMPLVWMNSVIVVILILIMLVLIYNYKKKYNGYGMIVTTKIYFKSFEW